MTVPSYSIPHEKSYVFPDEVEHVVEELEESQRSAVLAGHDGAVGVPLAVAGALRDVL